MAIDWGKSHLGKLMGTTYSSSSQNGKSETNILKQVSFEGRYKVFEDVTGEHYKVELMLDNDKSIVFHKEVSKDLNIGRYKDLEIYNGNALIQKINIFASDHLSKNPSYRFFYSQVTIGTGKGDVALYIAYKLLSEEHAFDTRFLADSTVDEGVMRAIKEVVESKNY